ncbi:MAG: chemotaxis protein CheD [Caulobacterales bacterium]
MHVIQGEYRVSDEEHIVLSTVLGSCVAACIRDPHVKIGGMNHFLLPGDSNASGESLSYGVNAMELLINDILRHGGRRDRLEARLFGGARIVRGLSDIGAQNAAFAESFLLKEGISCIGASLGGVSARRIQFWPANGRARQMLLPASDDSVVANEAKVKTPPPAEKAGDLELF